MFALQQYKEQFVNTIDHLKQEISGLRTGRATPALVEDIIVEAYNVRQPVKALASISVVDAKTITVQPWDKSILQNLDAGIRASNLGINPVNDGVLLRLVLPDLTQERRGELIKVLHTKLEQARIGVRKVREEIRDTIDRAEKEKQISEDEKFSSQEDLEKMVKDYNESIKQIGEEKEKEIQTI
ncbi:MAG TPA: ribosome recycling factor [Candidatus Magasanikbacteria bacterium]|nr:MAG: ribosome recycling factor [Candidatus Magasanikbacteria bacterium RIFCSPLOWO2_02_FULL_47_16]OGH80127.1 MAG: ribosome recycling factor [Candidatus Magasanikbacteria bacterium RIFCSPHIGHO2_02_FULL_48_18]OGH82681.1 MAG: ribosome recycling factor [Candidatus Magasanikbacteria bacterium RIFCSPLOWO2_12_FULL_47_9b]HAZ28957.1 ribosome recycling factor [Candidatus Magasanikbacteria bacterium]